jgi:hypothetical protein
MSKVKNVKECWDDIANHPNMNFLDATDYINRQVSFFNGFSTALNIIKQIQENVMPEEDQQDELMKNVAFIMNFSESIQDPETLHVYMDSVGEILQ